MFKSGVLRFLTPFVRWLKSLYHLRSLLDYIGANADENDVVIIELRVWGKWCYNEEGFGSSAFINVRTSCDYDAVDDKDN